MKILYVIDKFQLGGAQRNCFELIKRINKRKFKPYVVCIQDGGPFADDLKKIGIKVKVLGLKKIYTSQGIREAWQLKEFVRKKGIDLIHNYIILANVYGTLIGRWANNGIRIITTRRGIGYGRKWRLRIFEEWLINPLTNLVITVCNAAKDITLKEPNLNGHKVVTIYNGIDLKEFDELAKINSKEKRRQIGLNEKEKVITTVANLTPIKAHKYLLKAACEVIKEFPNVRFLLVGDGPLRKDLERQAENLGIKDKMIFLGRRRDIPSILKISDLTVLPSFQEGMSNALLEYMAAGKPVVATNVGGNPEVVVDGVTGILVSVADSDALASGILKLLCHEELAKEMGRMGRKRIEENFTIEKMITKYESLYENLINGTTFNNESN